MFSSSFFSKASLNIEGSIDYGKHGPYCQRELGGNVAMA